MRRLFLVFFAFLSILSLFADGRQEREKQSFLQIQFKIVNMTNEPIHYYFDRVYFRQEINGQEEFITRRMTINKTYDDYRSFFCIEYDILSKVFFRFSYQNGERIARENAQCIVIVFESAIYIIERPFDERIDYSNESLFRGGTSRFEPSPFWSRVDIGRKLIDINIENNSDITKDLSIYSINENPFKSISIRDGMYEIYTIDDALFSLVDIKIVIHESGRLIEEIYLKNNRNENIKILINNGGYEIRYY
jgi:hypothetical protein